MTKTLYYVYLGDNGTITSPVHLEGVFSIKKYLLTADAGKVLTKDGINFTDHVYIAENELSSWEELSARGQN